MFGTSAYCGACLAKADKNDKELLYNFGINFGLAFQLVDDILDYTGSKNQIGKNIHQDIIEGKITLPLYYILNDPSTKNNRELFNKLKSQSQEARINDLNILFEKTNAIEKTYAEVHHYCELAKNELKDFSSQDMESLIDVFSKRSY